MRKKLFSLNFYLLFTIAFANFVLAEAIEVITFAYYPTINPGLPGINPHII